MFLLTWDQFTIDSETVRNSSRWIALQLKERFLLGSLLFLKLQNFTPVSLSSPTHAPLPYPPPYNFTFIVIILSKHAGCSARIHLPALQKEMCTKPQREESCSILGLFFSFLFLKHEMQNAKPNTFERARTTTLWAHV